MEANSSMSDSCPEEVFHLGHGVSGPFSVDRSTLVATAMRRRPANYALAAGVFTVGWDRVANISVGTYNLKIATVLFLVSLLLTIGDPRPMSMVARRSGVLRWSFALLVVMAFASLFAFDRLSAVGQLARVTLGAVVPFAATIAAVRSRRDIVAILDGFVRGVVALSIFGVYQLVAFYVGSPQLIEYTGLSGGVARISSATYEASAFGQILVIGVAVELSRKVLQSRAPSVTLLGFFGVVGVLANTRLLLIVAPVFVLFLVRPWRFTPKVLARWIGPLFIACYGVLVVDMVSPSVVQHVISQFLSAFNRNEESSNAPRLAVMVLVVQLTSNSWLLGLGPGNLYHAATMSGQTVFQGMAPNEVVANNIWLQALADGGVLLVTVHLILVMVVIKRAYVRQSAATRPLGAAWISLVLVGGLFGSTFYDSSRWCLLAMALCVAAELQAPSLIDTRTKVASGVATCDAPSRSDVDVHPA